VSAPCQAYEHLWRSLAPGTGRGWLAALATGWRFDGDPECPDLPPGTHGNYSVGMVRPVIAEGGLP
jgi:hypothetical protein